MARSESNDRFFTLIRSLADRNLTILFLRLLAGRNPTITFYDRWPVGIQRSYFTIVGRLESNDHILRSLAGRVPTVFDTIVGQSEYNDSFFRSLAGRNPTMQRRLFLRPLADRNLTIPFSVVGRSEKKQRSNDACFTIVGRSESTHHFSFTIHGF